MPVFNLAGGTSVNTNADRRFTDTAPMLMNGMGYTLNIPEGTRKVVKDAFYGLDSIQKINWASTLREIEPGAFVACSLPIEMTLPPFITLPANMFTECWPCEENKAQKIDFSEGTVHIGDKCFTGMWLQSIDIPASVETIGAGAFQGCGGENEDEVVLHLSGKNIKYIAPDAFDTPISEIIIDDRPMDSIPGWPWGAYRKTDGDRLVVKWSDGTTYYNDDGKLIKTLYPPNPATDTTPKDEYGISQAYREYGKKLYYTGAFAEQEMDEIRIPGYVEELPAGVFAGCWPADVNKGLKVIFENGVRRIKANAFVEMDISSIELPPSIEVIEPNAFYGVGPTSGAPMVVTIDGAKMKTMTDAFAAPDGTVGLFGTITINRASGAIAGAPWGAGKDPNLSDVPADIIWKGTR